MCCLGTVEPVTCSLHHNNDRHGYNHGNQSTLRPEPDTCITIQPADRQPRCPKIGYCLHYVSCVEKKQSTAVTIVVKEILLIEFITLDVLLTIARVLVHEYQRLCDITNEDTPCHLTEAKIICTTYCKGTSLIQRQKRELKMEVQGCIHISDLYHHKSCT